MPKTAKAIDFQRNNGISPGCSGATPCQGFPGGIMGRVFTRIVVIVSAVGLGGLALADDAKTPLKVQGDKALQKQGIVSVTDAQGNPLDLRGNAAPPKPDSVTKRKVSGTEAAVPTMQRGQGWWPY